MTKQDYEVQKSEIIRRLGKPEYDGQSGPENESARKLHDLKSQYLSSLRFDKAEKLKEAIDPSREKRSKEIRLKSIDLTENDLLIFTEKEQDILIGWFEDRSLTSKDLASRFNVSHQFVTALLRGPKAQKLESKYFHSVLQDNTKLALLKLTQDADPKAVLAAAEYLKLMHDKNDDVSGNKSIDDPEAEKALQILGDWLLGDKLAPLVITKEQLSCSNGL